MLITNRLLYISQQITTNRTTEASWNKTDETGKQVAAGMYFARLQAGDYSSVVKMVYLR